MKGKIEWQSLTTQVLLYSDGLVKAICIQYSKMAYLRWHILGGACGLVSKGSVKWLTKMLAVEGHRKKLMFLFFQSPANYTCYIRNVSDNQWTQRNF